MKEVTSKLIISLIRLFKKYLEMQYIPKCRNFRKKSRWYARTADWSKEDEEKKHTWKKKKLDGKIL